MEIFISYRREDSSGYALGFRREFAHALPDARVFLDVDSIEPGVRWRDAIKSRLRSSGVLLVVIGDEWLCRRDGVRRLEQPDDPVRFELKQALSRAGDLVLIPVLVEDTPMPASAQLPEDLRGLCEFNAHHIHDRSYDQDLNRLTERLRSLMAAGDPEGDQPVSLPSRVTERYLETNVPGMGRERLLSLITALHDRGWSDKEIYDHALGWSPLRPPAALPSRVTPAWLQEHVPLMSPERVPALVQELQRRRWTSEEIRRSVLDVHPRAAVTEIPARIHPAWLERNGPLMTPEFQRKVRAVLLQRGWAPEEIQHYLPTAAG